MVLTFISFLPCPPISLFEPFMAVSLFLTPSPITTNSYPLKYIIPPTGYPIPPPHYLILPPPILAFFLKPYLWTLSFHIFAPYPICVCKYIIAGIAYILFDRFAKIFNKLPGKDVKPLTVGIRPQKSVQKFMHIPVMDMQYFPPPHPIFSKA